MTVRNLGIEGEEDKLDKLVRIISRYPSIDWMTYCITCGQYLATADQMLNRQGATEVGKGHERRQGFRSHLISVSGIKRY